MPARWRNLLRHGLLGTSLLGLASAPAAADPCSHEWRVGEVQGGLSIGVVLGIDLSPRPRVIGGAEVRKCLTPSGEGFVRLEVGAGGPRLIGGTHVWVLGSEEDDDDARLGLEVGAGVSLRGQVGLHLAGTYGTLYAYGSLQSYLSLDPQPTRWTVLGGFSPSRFEAEVHPPVAGRPIQHGGQWLRPAFAAPLPAARDAEARAARDHFASSAQLELSSVWTFLRLAAELAAVGAPAELIARALDAADDEVAHAEACAAAAGGLALAPLPPSCARPRFAAPSAHALATLAAEAWAEGCLEETAAAEEARLTAAEAQGSIRATLVTIARDEARHAALAWDTLAWLFTVAPAVTGAALAGAPPPPAPGSTSRTVDPALVRRGVPSPAITAAARAHAADTARTRLADLAA